MSAILEVIAQVFVFTAKRVADVVCLALLIASCAAPWRWPWFCTSDGSRMMEWEDGKWWGGAALNFFAMLADLFTFPIFLMSLFSWRCVYVCAALRYELGQGSRSFSDFFYGFTFHGVAWYAFGHMLLDIVFFVLFIFCLVPFWRFHKLVVKIYHHRPKPLVDCTRTASVASWNGNRSCHRHIVWKHLTETKMMQALLNGIANLFCFLCGFVAMASLIRLKAYVEDWSAIYAKTDYAYLRTAQARLADVTQRIVGEKARIESENKEGAGIVVDEDERTPLEVATDEYELELYERRRGEWRSMSMLHGLLALRDIVCVPIALVVLGTLYRAPLLISKIKQRVSRWADFTKPVLAVTQQQFAAPPNGRKKGIVWRIRGTKQANVDASVADGPLLLYVRSSDGFWDSIGARLGGSIATFGQMLLPGRIDGEGGYIDMKAAAAAIGRAQIGDEVELVFDFEVKQSYTTIKDTCAKFPGPRTSQLATAAGGPNATPAALQNVNVAGNAHVQLELGTGHEQTLVALTVPLADIAAPVADQWISGGAPEFVTVATGRDGGSRFCDVFWQLTCMQFLLFMRDVLTLVGFVLLVAFPWRLWNVLSVFCAGPARAKALEVEAEIQDTAALVRGGKFADAVDAYVLTADQQARDFIKHGDDRYLPYYVQNAYREAFNEASEYCDKLAKRQEKLDAAAAASPSAATASDALYRLRQALAALANEFGCALQRAHGKDVTKHRFFMPRVLPDRPSAAGGANAAAASAAVPVPSSRASDISAPGGAAESIEDQVHRRAVRAERDACIAFATALEQCDAEYAASPCCDKSGNDGWDGVVAAVATQVAQVLYDFAALASLLLTCATVYRLPWMVRELCIAPKGHRRKACVLGVVEVVTDIGYLILFALVLVSIRGTIRIVTDLITMVPRYPSFKVARAVIAYNASVVFNIFYLCATLFFGCRIVKWVLATSVFSIMAPGVLLDSAILHLQVRVSDSQRSREGGNKCRAAVMLLVGGFWLVGVPLIANSQGKPDRTAAEYNTPAALYLGFMAAFVLLALVAAFIYRDPHVFTLRRPVVRFARLSFQNAASFVLTLFEGLQLVCLSLSALVVSGAVTNEHISRLADYVFLLFGESWTPAAGALPFGAYLCVAFMAVHYFIVSQPIICSYILDWDDAKHTARSSSYITLMLMMSYLASTICARNLGELLSCNGGRLQYVYGKPGANATALRAAPPAYLNLTDADYPTCWAGEHRDITIATMILATIAIPTAISRNAFFDESKFTSVDVVFSQGYRMIVGCGTVAMVVAPPLLGSAEQGLVCILVCSAWCLLWSIFYRCVVGALGVAGNEPLTESAIRSRAQARNRAMISAMYPTNSDGGDDATAAAARKAAAEAEESLEDPELASNYAYCTLPALTAGRVAIYAASTVAAAICLSVVRSHNEGSSSASSAPLGPDANMNYVYACLGVLFGGFVAAVAGTLLYHRCATHPEDQTVDALRAELLAFEAQAFNRGRMHRAWRDHRGAWAGAVAGAMRPAQLALSVAKLEEAMSTLRLTTAFARTRKAWYEALQRVVDRDADDDTEAAALNAINGRRGYCFCVEEDEGLCCEDMYSSRRRWRWNDDDEDALLTPLRMACAKQLAIVDRALQSLANATSDDETAAWSAGDAVFRFDEETQLTAVAQQQQAGDDSAQQQQQPELVRGDANANANDDDSTGSFIANPLADDPNRQYTSPSAVAANDAAGYGTANGNGNGSDDAAVQRAVRESLRTLEEESRAREAAGGGSGSNSNNAPDAPAEGAVERTDSL